MRFAYAGKRAPVTGNVRPKAVNMTLQPIFAMRTMSAMFGRGILFSVLFVGALLPTGVQASEETQIADRLMLALLAGDPDAAGKLEVLGNRGIARADTVLAFAHQEGKLGAKDPRKAVSLYRRASEAGDVLAQYRLAELLQGGKGVSADIAQAERWIVRAAEQGHALAQTYALMNFKRRVEPSRLIKQILDDFTRWADDGNVLAMYDLSYRYEVGRYVETDLQRASSLMQKAAEAGFAQAQSTLGTKYLTGKGVPASDTEAAKWFLRAAAQGSAMAQFFLGTMHEDGRGVTRDRTKAIAWFEKAAAQGMGLAEKQVVRLRSKPENDAAPTWSVTPKSGPVQ